MFTLSSVAIWAPRLTPWSVALFAWVVAAIVLIVIQLRPALTKALVRSHHYTLTAPLLAHIGGVTNAGAHYHHHPANWRLNFLYVWRKTLRWLQLCPLDPPAPALPAVRRIGSNSEANWRQAPGPATSSVSPCPHKPLQRALDTSATTSFSPPLTTSEPTDLYTATTSPHSQPPVRPSVITPPSDVSAATRPSHSPKLLPKQRSDDTTTANRTSWALPVSANGLASKSATHVTSPTPAPSPSNTTDVPKVSTVALTPNSSSSPPPTPTTPSVPLAEKCPLPSPTSPPSTESLPGASQGSRQLTSAKNTSKSRSKKKALAKRNLLPASSAALLPHTSLPAAVVIAKTKAAVSSVSSAASHRSTALPTKGRCSADGTENASPSPLQQSTAQPGHLHTSQPLTQPKELMPEPSHSAYPTPPVAELAVNSQPLSEDLFAHCQPIHRPKAVGRRSSSSLMPSDTTTSRSPPSQKMVTRSLEPSPELRARLSTTATSPRIHPFDSLSDATAIPPQPYLSSDGSRSCRRPAPTAKWFSPFDPHWQVSLDFLRSERQRQSQCRPPPGFPATPAGTTRPPLPLTQHRPASTAWDGFNALSTRHQRSASEQTSMPQPPPGLSNSRTGLCLPSPNNLPLRSSLDQSSLPMASQSVLLQAEPTASMLTTGRGPGGFGLSTSLAMAAPPPHYNLSFDGCLTTANDYRRPFTANAGGVAKYGAGNARRSSISPMLPSSCWNPASPMVMDPQPVPLPFQANGTNSARAAHLHQQPIGETSSLHFSAPLPDN